jgi:hypothetical protein
MIGKKISFSFKYYSLLSTPSCKTGVCDVNSIVLVRCRPPKPLAGLTSAGGLSVDAPAARPIFSLIVAIVEPDGPPLSLGAASNHRDKHVKLTINSIFLSTVSRALSTNKYKGDFSSCKFYE